MRPAQIRNMIKEKLSGISRVDSGVPKALSVLLGHEWRQGSDDKMLKMNEEEMPSAVKSFLSD